MSRSTSILTANEIIINLKAIHKNLYEYVDIKDYHKAQDKINIICPVHGLFNTYLTDHLRGRGCPSCLREISALKIIEKYRIKFYDKIGVLWPDYDFSEFIYTGCLNPSIVICKEHGIFTKRPVDLLDGYGCTICPKQPRISVEEIRNRIYTAHKDTYTYPDLDNKYVTDKIKIKCSKHGIFEQLLDNHFRGSGCPSCNNEHRSIRNTISANNYYKNNTEERGSIFIKKAMNKYGPTFDYSKVEYINTSSKVKIICCKHGEFLMTPYNHLQIKHGCIECANDNFGFDYVKVYTNALSGDDTGIFYKLLFTHIPTNIKFIKIGITKKSIEERYPNSQYSDFTYEIIEQIHDTNLNCAILEQVYKNENKHRRFFLPKNIEFSGRTETYCWDEDQQLEYKGISFLRDSLLEKQEGLCAICNQPPKRPVLDHDHKKKIKGTSFCRGTICSNCNVFLAKIENNAIRYGISKDMLSTMLLEIANYYDSEQTKFIHPTEKPKEKILGRRLYNKIIKAYKLKYPNRKPPEYPKRPILSVKWIEMMDDLCIGK